MIPQSVQSRLHAHDSPQSKYTSEPRVSAPPFSDEDRRTLYDDSGIGPAVAAENISMELKEDPSWVCWNYEWRDGKRTKNLYQTNGRQAKTNDPSTWTTFKAAMEAADRFDGIGFVFHDGNPYGGADIDHVTEEQAQRWIDRFDSYAERSPSGNGVHIIFKAKLPEGTKRPAGELYSSGRFFTMTGDVIRDAPVAERQSAAEEFYSYLRQNDQKAPETRPASSSSPDLSDAEILTLLERARTGAEFRIIYAGGGDFPSASERDLSLAIRVAFYTQDEHQIERIMWGSACVREKWIKHRSYLKRTIRKAISGLTNTYAPAETINIGTIRASKKTELADGVRDLRRRWWDYDWARVAGTEKKPNWMRGHTCRDVMIVLIDATAKHGKVVGDNIEVSLGRRKLALQAATSTRTVHKAVKHLEAEGWLEFRPPDSENKPGTYVMRASLHQVLSIHTRGVELEAKEGGGEDLRAGGVVPRLRWSAPYVPRLGKHNCAIVDRLVREGDMHVDELAEAINKRTRDLLRRNLPRLEGAGIIQLDGGTVRLADDWREALERRREEDGEIQAEKRDRKKYQEQNKNYRNRDKTPADNVPPLMGREKMAAVLTERAKEDFEVRIKQQRQKVGTTAEVFVHDKVKALGQIRLGLLRDVYADAGGNPKDVLAAAVRLGCRIERLPEYQNERFIFPPESRAAS
jgi:hypothetical protein